MRESSDRQQVTAEEGGNLEETRRLFLLRKLICDDAKTLDGLKRHKHV